MNFTEFLTAFPTPIYEEEAPPAMEDPGEGGQPEEDKDKKIGCPKGYKWDKKTMRCVPKSEKDSVGGKEGTGGAPSYRVWGNSGYDGGYAWEEPQGPSDAGGLTGGIE